MDFSQTDIVRISKVVRLILRILSLFGSTSAAILLTQDKLNHKG